MASIFGKCFCKCSVKRSVTVLNALQSFKTGQMSLKISNNNNVGTLKNLLCEKGLPTTGGPRNKGIVASQKRHPALSFDSQSNR